MRKFRYLKCLLYILIFVAVERFCYQQTRGFRLYKVQLPLSEQLEEDRKVLSSEEEKKIVSLLEMPFRYLDAGGQCYAFLSVDGSVVLKLLKQHRIRVSPWVAQLPLPSYFSVKRDRYVEVKKKRCIHTLDSLSIASRSLKEVTGCIYSHLHPTKQWKKTITIIDPIGVVHKLDADTTQFLLQKRLDRVDDHLEILIREEQKSEIHKCLKAIAAFVVQHNRNYICSRDLALHKNVGFSDGKVMLIDVGDFTSRESPLSGKELQQQSMKASKSFIKWLMTKDSSLVSSFQNEIQVGCG